jgi:hypothetical protein
VTTTKVTNTKVTIRINPGTYQIVFSGNGYASQTIHPSIQQSTTYTTPTLDYTTEHLGSLLVNDRTAIRNTIIPGLNLSGYTITYESLYKQGQWYGAILTPPDVVNQDIVRLVAEYKDGKWQVVAGPDIYLYINKYPAIPQDVMLAINNRYN